MARSSTIRLVTLLALSVCGNAKAQSFDPNAMRNQAEICRVLDRLNPEASHRWGQSRSTPGGYVCTPLGSSKDIGSSGPRGTTTINAFVYGSGPRKLDRATLKINVFNPATADAGKDALVTMAKAMAQEMRLELPPGVESTIRAQRVEMRNNLPEGQPRTVFKERIGAMLIEVARDQSRITSIVVYFRNPDASNLWN